VVGVAREAPSDTAAELAGGATLDSSESPRGSPAQLAEVPSVTGTSEAAASGGAVEVTMAAGTAAATGPPTEGGPAAQADLSVAVANTALAIVSSPDVGGIEMAHGSRQIPVPATPAAREFRDPNNLTLVLPGVQTAGSQRVLDETAMVGIAPRGNASTARTARETVPTGRTADLFRTMNGVQSLCDFVACRVVGRRGFSGFNDPPTNIGQAGCDLQFFVDGVPYNGALPDLTIDLIESVEVYNSVSQLPAQYHGPQARCGVVVIQTRR
jgi:hypothetical protein